MARWGGELLFWTVFLSCALILVLMLVELGDDIKPDRLA
jgi:hypothetical protein